MGQFESVPSLDGDVISGDAGKYPLTLLWLVLDASELFALMLIAHFYTLFNISSAVTSMASYSFSP